MEQGLIPFMKESEYYTAILNLVQRIIVSYRSFMKSTKDIDVLFQKNENRDASCLYEAELREINEERQILQEKAKKSIQNHVMITAEYVRQQFEMDDFMSHCFMLSLAAELDSNFGLFYSCTNSNENPYPSFDFCLRTYSILQEKRTELLSSYYDRLENTWNILFEDDTQREFPFFRVMCLRRRLVRFIMNLMTQDESLDDRCRMILPSDVREHPMLIHQAFLDKVNHLTKIESPMLIYLYGQKGSGRRTLAANCFEKRNQICLQVDSAFLTDEIFCREVVCEIKLRNAGVCLLNFNSFLERTSSINTIFRSLLDASKKVIICAEGRYPLDKSSLPAPMPEMEISIPCTADREILWRNALSSYGFSSDHVATEPDAAELAARFSFTPGQIQEAAKEAFLLSIQYDFSIEMIYKACFRQLAHELGKKAVRIEPQYTWDDLILPDLQKGQLKEACDQICYQQHVYENWGFREKIAYGRGVSMLFSGSPGTGKTMAAQVIANSLHLELYKVELSSVISKYIGETQKALNSIFEEVKKSQSILFFDEADSLFAKRSEVKDSNDRFANAETAYLLQKIEEYEGIVILATNYMQNFDIAFKRRIKFVIEFPLPSEKERLQIWKQIFPFNAPLEEQLDYRYLAHTFKFSGSSIKNIAVAAAFRAASRKRGILMKDVLLAVKDEMKKSGKMLNNSEFGEYASVIETGEMRE